MISIREEENYREVFGLIENDIDDWFNAIQEYNKNFKLILPLHISPCQKIHFLGTKIYAAPYFKSVDHGCFGYLHI